LQYEAPDKVRGLCRRPAFYLQICVFLSGAEGSRTPDLRRAKAKKHVLAYPSVSSNFGVLQGFCTILDDSLSTTYRSVSARLQYGKQHQRVPGTTPPTSARGCPRQMKERNSTKGKSRRQGWSKTGTREPLPRCSPQTLPLRFAMEVPTTCLPGAAEDPDLQMPPGSPYFMPPSD
jgi:hypothetical protein